MNPILFLDVDGVLNPLSNSKGTRPPGFETHRLDPLVPGSNRRWSTVFRKELRVWLNPNMGAELLRLPVDIVWATTWMDEANEFIGPRVGLPTLPVVKFVDLSGPARDTMTMVYFKTARLVEYAAGRPFAWFDDEIGSADRSYVQTHGNSRSLLRYIDPRHGITPADLLAVSAWATVLPEEELR